MGVDEYFSSGPPHERPVFDAVMSHLETVGPFHAGIASVGIASVGIASVGIASVGIFLENPRTFAELRPLQNWVAISFSLARRARHRTITRKVVEYGHTFWHVANVATPHDLDPDLLDLLDLLTEAYRLAAR